MSRSRIYQHSGVLPYEYRDDTFYVYLITSLKKGHLILPKGVNESSRSSRETAVTEAWEEAGLIGIIGKDPIGEYTTKKWGGICTIALYPLKVLATAETYPEQSIRERFCLPALEAAEKLYHTEASLLIRRWLINKEPRS